MKAMEFINKFEKLNDSKKWELVINNQDLDFTIMVDNDDISICFNDDNEDNELYASFDEFGYDALVTLLNTIKINAEYV